MHLSIGSRQTPLPQRILGRDLFRYLDATGLIRKTRRLADRPADGGPRHPDRLEPARLAPRTASSSTAAPSAPTGSTVTFERRRSALDVRTRDLGDRLPRRPLVDRRAGLRPRRAGRCTSVASPSRPGLYFLGLSWQHTRGSALLGWVKDDAEHVAEQIDAAPSRSRRHRNDRTGPLRGAQHEQHHDHFPTDVAGLPDGAGVRARRARRRRRVRPADRPGGQAARRRDRADAGLQRLDPRARR